VICVARDQHDARIDVAASRAHARTGSVQDLGDLGALVDAHAEGRGGARLAETEVQRMQVTVAAVQQAADVRAACEEIADPLARDQLHVVVPEPHPVERTLLLGECTHVTRLDRDIHVPVPEIAGDRIARDAVLDDCVAPPGDVVDQPLGTRAVEFPEP
jgi:hypothetical protein